MGKGMRILSRRPVKWLIALVVAISIGIYLLTLPSCRTDRVVVAGTVPGKTLVKLITVTGRGLDVIWEGVAGYGSPIEIPFVLRGEGNFRIEVWHEGREEPIVHDFAYLTLHYEKTYYVVIGVEEILDFSEGFRGFDTPDGEGSDFTFAFQFARYIIGDALTCLDGR